MRFTLQKKSKLLLKNLFSAKSLSQKKGKKRKKKKKSAVSSIQRMRK